MIANVRRLATSRTRSVGKGPWLIDCTGNAGKKFKKTNAASRRIAASGNYIKQRRELCSLLVESKKRSLSSRSGSAGKGREPKTRLDALVLMNQSINGIGMNRRISMKDHLLGVRKPLITALALGALGLAGQGFAQSTSSDQS